MRVVLIIFIFEPPYLPRSVVSPVLLEVCAQVVDANVPTISNGCILRSFGVVVASMLDGEFVDVFTRSGTLE